MTTWTTSGPGRADTDGSVVIDYEPAEEAIAATGITIRHGGARAFYSPSEDFVQVPPKASFTEPDEYYETVFHELVHATEHPSRLNWSRKEEGPHLCPRRVGRRDRRLLPGP